MLAAGKKPSTIRIDAASQEALQREMLGTGVPILPAKKICGLVIENSYEPCFEVVEEVKTKTELPEGATEYTGTDHAAITSAARHGSNPNISVFRTLSALRPLPYVAATISDCRWTAQPKDLTRCNSKRATLAK